MTDETIVNVEPYSLADTMNEGCLVTCPTDWDRMVATIEENAALRAALRVRTNDEEWRMRFVSCTRAAVACTGWIGASVTASRRGRTTRTL